MQYVVVDDDIRLSCSRMDSSKETPSYSTMVSCDQNLETVRALHQTIVSLRSALEQSRSELFELRVKVNSSSNTKVFADTIEKLSLENHVLRERLLSSEASLKGKDQLECDLDEQLSVQLFTFKSSNSTLDQHNRQDKVALSANSAMDETEAELPSNKNIEESSIRESMSEAKVIEEQSGPEAVSGITALETESIVIADTVCDTPVSKDETKQSENEPVLDSDNKENEKGDISINVAQESDNESEELDDIELIFTTEETKELGVMQEDLVSFSDTENWVAADCRPSPCITVEKSTQFDEENTGLCMPWNQSIVVETDISKCGIIDENEAPPTSALRRNTLPSPLPYRPIIHKEILTASKSPSHSVKFTTSRSSRSNGTSDSRRLPMRPILVEQNSSPKRESEAQTDITALPSHWKSESYLAHKVSHQFTTLPSKFTLPSRQAVHCRPSLKICDRNQDARRILLSDINFTSMVPELSRSADHLALESGVLGVAEPTAAGPTLAGLYRNFPRAFSYMKNTDGVRQCLVSPGYQHSREYGRFHWSPCDCLAQGKWECPVRCQSSQSSSTSPQSHEAESKLRNPVKASISSFDVCRHGHIVQRSASSSWQSEPASPTHSRLHNRARSIPLSSSYSLSRNKLPGASMTCGFRFSPATVLGHGGTFSRNRVSFQEGCLRRPGRGGQSLPDLRLTDGHGDSGESTDSLIDEAEDYVRRSIDSIITGADLSRISKRRMARRHSDPDPTREFSSPASAQPFLPKAASDLKVDHLVKVITSEGRVSVGRVRYVGAVSGLAETYVGLELANGNGDSDGTFRGRRYFECDQNRSVFVPFKKVVMAWKT